MKLKNSFNQILKTQGFKNIELDSIIESKHILKRSGGNFRQYLFSFYDQNFREWSLRPDLTISSVTKFIKDKSKNRTKWYYTGEAYRKSNKRSNSVIKKQTGFEIYASKNENKDDEEIVKTSIKIFKKTNFKKAKLNIGNIEIFYALVNRLDMPIRWKERIKRHFSREAYLNKLLKKLSTNSDINFEIVKQDKKRAEKLRKENPKKLFSGRSLKEILDRFDIKNYSDPRVNSNKKNVKIIRDYFKISCSIEKAPVILNNFFKKNNLNIIISPNYFPIKKNNFKNVKILFTTNIGRNVPYYSNMVFNIQVKIKNKIQNLISGGRYNGLVKNLGYTKSVPAVGAAIDLNLL